MGSKKIDICDAYVDELAGESDTDLPNGASTDGTHPKKVVGYGHIFRALKSSSASGASGDSVDDYEESLPPEPPRPVRQSSIRSAPSGGAFEASPTEAAAVFVVSDVDWSKEFVELVEQLEGTRDDLEASDHRTYTKLCNLANNFLDVAKTYGKVIISERALPVAQKTIKPTNIGGLAGGEKYKIHNILFKFAVDWKGYYGGDEYVMKAAGHELKGLMAVYQCQLKKLHVPLMCLIDYKGYRLIAISILPISGSTLVYGSSDGGATVHATQPEICRIMKAVGKKLNLKEHWGGLDGPQKLISGPTDMEVHATADGKYFVCDFARLFPPAVDGTNRLVNAKRGSFLYTLLRPELVRRSPVPLSSDACSRFGYHSKEVHDREVHQMTQWLLDYVIPNFAIDISRSGFEFGKLIPMLHREGINCRYLGMVRAWASSADAREKLLTECVARVMKNMIRKRMRNLLSERKFALEEYFRNDLLEFLNMALGSATSSGQFWRVEIKSALQETFVQCLSKQEQSPDFDLSSMIPRHVLIARVQQITGFELDHRLLDELRQYQNRAFELVASDIEKLAERTKHMNVIEYAEATSLYIQSTQRHGTQKARLFDLAMKKFEAAVAAKPDDAITLTAWGNALYAEYQRTFSDGMFHQAVEKYKAAKDGDRLLTLGIQSRQRAESSANYPAAKPFFDKAIFLFEAALELNPHDSRMELGRLYYSQFRRFDNQVHCLALAGKFYRQALTLMPEQHSEEVLRLCQVFADNDEDLANVLEIAFRNEPELFGRSRNSSLLRRRGHQTPKTPSPMMQSVSLSSSSSIIDDPAVPPPAASSDHSRPRANSAQEKSSAQVPGMVRSSSGSSAHPAGRQQASPAACTEHLPAAAVSAAALRSESRRALSSSTSNLLHPSVGPGGRGVLTGSGSHLPPGLSPNPSGAFVEPSQSKHLSPLVSAAIDAFAAISNAVASGSPGPPSSAAPSGSRTPAMMLDSPRGLDSPRTLSAAFSSNSLVASDGGSKPHGPPRSISGTGSSLHALESPRGGAASSRQLSGGVLAPAPLVSPRLSTPTLAVDVVRPSSSRPTAELASAAGSFRTGAALRLDPAGRSQRLSPDLLASDLSSRPPDASQLRWSSPDSSQIGKNSPRLGPAVSGSAFPAVSLQASANSVGSTVSNGFLTRSESERLRLVADASPAAGRASSGDYDSVTDGADDQAEVVNGMYTERIPASFWTEGRTDSLDDFSALEKNGSRILRDSSVVADYTSEHIKIFDWRWTTRMSMTAMVKTILNCASLQRLSLAKLTALTDDELTAILRACPAVVAADLSGCHLLSDASVATVPQHWPKLDTLLLHGCWQVSDASVVTLGALSLKTLSLECKKVTDAALMTLFATCSALRTLRLNRCLRLSTGTFDLLASKCLALEELRIKWCPGLTDDALLAFGSLPSLKKLRLAFTLSVTEQGVWAMMQRSQSIELVLAVGFELRMSKYLQSKDERRSMQFINRPAVMDKYDLKLFSGALVVNGLVSYGTASHILSFLAESQQCKAVEFGHLELCCQSCLSAVMLGMSLSRSITSISISDTGLGESGARQLAEALHQHTKRGKIDSLALNYVRLGVQGLKFVLDAFSGSELELRGNEIGPEGAALITEFVRRNGANMRRLTLSRNPLGEQGAGLVLEGMQDRLIGFKHVTLSHFALDLSDCGIGPIGAQRIGQLIESNPDLASLNLSDNHLGDEGLAALARGLASNQQLTELNLDGTEVSDTGLAELSKALSSTKVSTLSLNRNKVVGDGFVQFAHSLLENELSTVSVNHNPLGIKAIQSLVIALDASNLKHLNLTVPEADASTHEYEQALISLASECRLAGCDLNLGNVSFRVKELTKQRYHSYVREHSQRQKDAGKDIETRDSKRKSVKDMTASFGWQQQMKSDKLSQFLLKKDVDE